MTYLKDYTIPVIGVVLVALLNLLLVHFESQVEGSSITSYIDALWYTAVTLTTVGYGDFYPISHGGRVIGYIYVFASLGILGFLFSKISNNIYTMLEEKKLGFKGTNFEKHIVFIGWNDFSHMVASELVQTEKKLAILTEEKDSVDLIYDQYGKKDVFVLFGDFQNLDALDKLNASKASVIFITVQNDADALMMTVNIKNKCPEPQIVVSLENSKLKETFRAAGVTHLIARNEIASKMVASYIFEPDVADLNSDLLSSAKHQFDFDIQEYEVIASNPYLGKTGKEAFHELKNVHDVVLMGISKTVDGERQLSVNPDDSVSIEVGDYLMVMLNGESKKKVREDFGVTQGRIS